MQQIVAIRELFLNRRRVAFFSVGILSFIASTVSIAPANANNTGVIQGRLSYPSDFVPPMRVCAQSTSNYYLMSCVSTKGRDRTSFQNFKLTVSPGEYFVFAYASKQDTRASFNYQAYYANANNPIPIRVVAGKTIANIQANQWQLCNRNPQPSYCIAPSGLSSSTQSTESPQSGTIKFMNPNWKPVPSAEVGRHSAETLMNINGLLRQGDDVTFDVIGYQGAYYRMSGSCRSRQVAVTRRGLQTRDGATYTEIAPNEVTITNWHRQLLLFACQNSSR